MSRGSILWLTGIVPSLSNIGLVRGEIRSFTNIMYESLIESLSKRIENDKSFKIITDFPKDSKRIDLAFFNGRRIIFIISNPAFSSKDLYNILSVEPDAVIIFLRKPDCSKSELLMIAQEFEVRFITQRLPQIEWSPKFEYIESESDEDILIEIHHLNRFDTSMLTSESNMHSFLEKIPIDRVRIAAYRKWKKWFPIILPFLEKLIIECAKGLCGYITGFKIF